MHATCHILSSEDEKKNRSLQNNPGHPKTKREQEKSKPVKHLPSETVPTFLRVIQPFTQWAPRLWPLPTCHLLKNVSAAFDLWNLQHIKGRREGGMEVVDWWLARLLVCWYSFTRVKCDGRENKSGVRGGWSSVWKKFALDGLLMIRWITFFPHTMLYFSFLEEAGRVTKRMI